MGWKSELFSRLPQTSSMTISNVTQSASLFMAKSFYQFVSAEYGISLGKWTKNYLEFSGRRNYLRWWIFHYCTNKLKMKLDFIFNLQTCTRPMEVVGWPITLKMDRYTSTQTKNWTCQFSTQWICPGVAVSKGDKTYRGCLEGRSCPRCKIELPSLAVHFGPTCAIKQGKSTSPCNKIPQTCVKRGCHARQFIAQQEDTGVINDAYEYRRSCFTFLIGGTLF